MDILVVDIGGTNVKMLASGQEKRRKFVSGQKLTPDKLVDGVRRTTADWKWDRVTVGIPAMVRAGRVVLEPKNLGPGWIDFDFEKAFGMPTKVINDAAMQALGSYQDGGTMLFMGLGTGLGTALVADRHVLPLECAHLPYRDGTFEDHVGERGLLKFGRRKWQEHVADITERLRLALVADYVVIGGGNVKKLQELPQHAHAGNNRYAFFGGFRLWEDSGYRA
jgi:predicted NBD/HSP70 family sugar kinase